MDFHEALVMDSAANVRRTNDGYLLANPRVARTGVQLYLGSELGRADMAVVRVYRPEEAVFDQAAMSSMAYKPITNDHPPENVTDKNWRKYGIGQAGGEVARDGDFIRVPMMLMDGNAIEGVLAGKRELSVGYGADIVWGGGTTPTGEVYDAKMNNIRANHIAVVDAARGGEKLRIGDGIGQRVDIDTMINAVEAIGKGNVNTSDVLKDGSALNVAGGSKAYPFFKDGVVYEKALRQVLVDANVAGDKDVAQAASSLLGLMGENEVTTTHVTTDGETDMNAITTPLKTRVIDGISVEMTDVAAQVVDRHIATLTAAVTDTQKRLDDATSAHATVLADKDKQIATLTTEAATKDAKIATLETQAKDSAMTPEKLDALVKDRAVIAGKAKAVLSSVVTDGKTDGEIMRQVVDAKLGDKAKGWDDTMVKASFDTLTAAVKPADSATNMAAQQQAFSSAPAFTDASTESEQRYAARDKKLQDAWKGDTAGKA